MEELKVLVERAREGQPEAYAAVVRRFQDMAVGYAYSLLGDFHLAEDAAQEAFVGAYLDLGRLRDPAAFPGWFRRIVFMRCQMMTRRKRVATTGLDAADTLAVSGRPDELLETRDTREHVQRAIEQLPEPERAVTTLFYINDFSQKEIAAFLDTPQTTVNNRLHGARKRLKKELLQMAKENLRQSRPSKDENFANRVREHLQTLETLHTDLADELAKGLGELLNGEVQVGVVSTKKSTFPEFGSALAYPLACIYHGVMQPATGRVAFVFAWPLVWEIVERLSDGAHSVARDEVRNLQEDEMQLVHDAAKVVIGCLEAVWRDTLEIKLADIMLETSPKALLEESPPEIKAKFTAEELARIVGWVPEADEPIVHIALQLQIGELSSAMDFCYTPSALHTALSHLART